MDLSLHIYTTLVQIRNDEHQCARPVSTVKFNQTVIAIQDPNAYFHTAGCQTKTFDHRKVPVQFTVWPENHFPKQLHLVIRIPVV